MAKLMVASLLGVICLLGRSSALMCYKCNGPTCVDASKASNQNCTPNGQDTCVMIKFAGYVERYCGINSQYCTVAGFKQNQAGVYNAIWNYFTNTLSKTLQDSDIASALSCCTTDYCNGGSGQVATLAILLTSLAVAYILV